MGGKKTVNHRRGRNMRRCLCQQRSNQVSHCDSLDPSGRHCPVSATDTQFYVPRGIIIQKYSWSIHSCQKSVPCHPVSPGSLYWLTLYRTETLRAGQTRRIWNQTCGLDNAPHALTHFASVIPLGSSCLCCPVSDLCRSCLCA